MANLSINELELIVSVLDSDIFESEMQCEHSPVDFKHIETLEFYLNRAKLREKLMKAIIEESK